MSIGGSMLTRANVREASIQVTGENIHTLSTPEIPSHNHTLHDPGHNHNLTGNIGVPTTSVGGTIPYGGGSNAGVGNVGINPATTGITIDAAGGGGAHNTVSRSITGTWYRKL